MSKDHEGDNKEYIHVKRAWYAKSALENMDYVDTVQFGFYSPDGGTSGEMSMKWYILSNVATPRLEVFTDSWHALAQFKEVAMEREQALSMPVQAAYAQEVYAALPCPVTYQECRDYLKPHDGLDAAEVMQLARKLWLEAHEEEQ